MLTMDEARARVAKGAAHLDVVRPGWERRIDVWTLTLHDPCGCIVGQLCGLQSLGAEAIGDPFERGCQMLFGGSDETIYDTFGVELQEVAAYDRQRYQPLQDAWIEAIAARLHPIVDQRDNGISEQARTDDAVAGADEADRPDTSRNLLMLQDLQ